MSREYAHTPGEWHTGPDGAVLSADGVFLGEFERAEDAALAADAPRMRRLLERIADKEATKYRFVCGYVITDEGVLEEARNLLARPLGADVGNAAQDDWYDEKGGA